MTNTQELEVAILRANKTKKSIAKALGISEMSFFRKLNNLTEFKASEIVALSKLLAMTDSQRDVIFFANNSD